MLQKPVFALPGCQRMSVNTLLCDTLALADALFFKRRKVSRYIALIREKQKPTQGIHGWYGGTSQLKLPSGGYRAIVANRSRTCESDRRQIAYLGAERRKCTSFRRRRGAIKKATATVQVPAFLVHSAHVGHF